MSDRYRLELELVGLPTAERNARRHWITQNKETQAWRRVVGFAVLGREPDAPLPVARVVFTRHSAREPDPRNLEESFKAVEDALVVSGILENDTSQNFAGGRPEILWEKAPPKKGFITITVEEIRDDGEED